MVNKFNKVVVEMSGGVDSTVSAWLLKDQGYQVEGVFMKNWEEDDKKYCNSKKDLDDVISACKILKIHLHTVNFASEYWDIVFKNFLNGYKNGITPNPDIICNKEIKFKMFFKFAKKYLNANFIATGHYVRLKKLKNQVFLIKGFDDNNDQSYFLYSVDKEILKNCIFPLGNMTKIEVRKLAYNIGFTNAYKKSSTGICFIGKRKFKNFISTYISAKPGLIVSNKGYKLGYHDGLPYYTIGQRKGLKIGGIKKDNRPWYVASKNINDNLLVVVQGKNHPELTFTGLVAYQVSWINSFNYKYIKCTAKIRYRSAEINCTVLNILQNKVLVKFQYPTNTVVTPGQSVVFYKNRICLGGGIIKKSLKVNYFYNHFFNKNNF